MDRRTQTGLAGTVLLAAAAVAPADDPTELKVNRVAIFSSGVAYFEREATVSGAASAELKFRTQQVNDILKSLVVQDLDGGRVGVVSYASKDPLERTLRSFAVDLTGNPSMSALLGQLRGEPVEIAGPRQMKGVIVGVEQQQVPSEKGPPVAVHYLNILTDTGLQQLRVDQLQGVKLANEKVASELQKALATLAGGRDADKKSVVIRFEGEGQRRVQAAFLLESPIWKTSYRLVLDKDKKPFLQGWATVENATEEDWKDIRLSLVSGRPISFQMDLYTPIYIPRPQEDLELYASLRAPQFDAGFGFGVGAPAVAATPPPPAAMDAVESLDRADKPAAAPARGRSTLGRKAGATAAGRVLREEVEALRLADTGVQSVAAAQEAGELFEYVIQTPVSIARQNSAMLPIVNEEVAGEKVSIYNPSTHAKYPLNGLLLENTTDLHLMQGPVTLFDGSVYAGDAKLPDLKSKEKRLLAYALDLAVDVMVEQRPQPDELVSLRIERGVLYHRHRNVDERVYTIHNKDDKDRVMLIEHAYSPGWTLLEPKEPFERTQNLLRFRVPVAAGKTVTQVVRMENVGEQVVALSEVGLDGIQMFLRARVISPAVKQALEKVVAMRTELDQVARQRGEREKEVNEAVAEQGRVRENLKTIQQGTDPYTRQLNKFDALETQIEKLRGQVSELRAQEEQKRQALEKFLLELKVE